MVAVAAAASLGTGLVAALDQRAFWGEPREEAVVVAVRASDRDLGSGRTRCAAEEIDVTIAAPREGMPPETSARECAGTFQVGETIPVQRRPDGRTYLQPLTIGEVAQLSGVVALAFLMAGWLWWVVRGAAGSALDWWAALRGRRRGRHLPDRWTPPSRRPGGRGQRVVR